MKNIILRKTLRQHALLGCLMLLPLSSVCLQASAQQIAFPGAEGWGRFATGGRGTDPAIGSKVYYVTSLEDYLSTEEPIEGTLRWALSTGDDTPRTILFKVGGTIILKERLKCPKPNVTIAGQSAPGGGICISGANIYIHSKNFIVRYIRFRAGDLSGKNYSSLGIENTENVIIDHCSFSWSMEENVTMYDNKYTTMQWCILSEPLYVSKHDKGARGYGAQWGGEHSTFHHNLFAHCVGRTPLVNGARDKAASGHDAFVDTEIINNVHFNWGNKGALYGGQLHSIIEGAYSRTNLINNYYKPGPATNTFQERWFADCSHDASSATGLGEWFIDGNLFETNEYKNDKNKGDHSQVNTDNWIYADGSNSKKAVNLRAGTNLINDIKLTTPSASSDLHIETAEEAYYKVIRQAGAQLPKLDAVDTRILAEAAGESVPVDRGAIKWNKTEPASPTVKFVGMINSQDDLKPADADENWTPWPDLTPKNGESVPIDTDGDGIPDSWEDANGLDKNNPSDGGAISANGYSNLENYLNNLAGGGGTSIERPYATNSEVSALYITSLTGAQVYSSHPQAKKNEINLPALQPGVYIITYILADGNRENEKIIVTN